MEPSHPLPRLDWPIKSLPAGTTPDDPAFDMWRPQSRFAPGGPSYAAFSVPVVSMALGLPTYVPGPLPLARPEIAEPEVASQEPISGRGSEAEAPLVEQQAAPPEAYWFPPLDAVTTVPAEPEPAVPPEAVLVQPPVLREVVVVAEPPPLGIDEHAAEPADNLTSQHAAPPAAYWATAPAVADKAEDSLGWNPPKTAVPETRRAPQAMAGLWAAEPVPSTAYVPPVALASEHGRLPRVAKLAATVTALAAVSLAAAVLLPRLFSGGSAPVATFNAPMMVLRAANSGRVANVEVKNGQTVEPSTLLLTIHTEPRPDPAESLLQDRLDAARMRLTAADDALGQPIPSSDPGRAKLVELRRQRSAATTDVAQLQDAVANLPTKSQADQPVRAGVHGVIRSLEAQAGTLTVSGVPLVRILDCDHAFLTLPPGTTLKPGQAVLVRLANLPSVRAMVRASTGIAEPPDSLVIAPAPGAFVNILGGTCPLGASATVTLAAPES